MFPARGHPSRVSHLNRPTRWGILLLEVEPFAVPSREQPGQGRDQCLGSFSMFREPCAMQPVVLIVEDEDLFRRTLTATLRDEHFTVFSEPSAASALQLLDEREVDIVITDVRMPGMNGIEFLERARQHYDTDVIVMSAYGTIETAVDAMKKGATDYVLKPFLIEDMLLRLKRLWEYRSLTRLNAGLRREIKARHGYADLVGASRKMQQVYELIEKVGPLKTNVLITGESGTGKELVAHAIHMAGAGKDKPFIPVNCCALPEGIAESELFGHVKGAFTGATDNTIGLFEAAAGGTLFFDEISSSPPSLQAKLLRACERKEILALGSKKPRQIDVRIIAATNRDLKEEAAAGRFREDLYYRLAVVEAHLPSLRERKEDIPGLANHFVAKYAAEFNCPCTGIDTEAVVGLMKYDWPGNVRELENVIERAMILSNSEILTAADIATAYGPSTPPAPSSDELRTATREFERQHISRVLQKAQNDKTLAAQMLGIGLSSLYRKIEDLNIDTN